MKAYSRAALAPVMAASSVSSLSCRDDGGSPVVASGSAGRPVDVGAAARALASLLLEGLSDQDFAVFASRLVPHLQDGRLDDARAHSAYTVASLAAELGVSARAIRCAITRHELQAVKRGSRWIISADAVGEWASAPDARDATPRRRRAALPPAPKAAGPSLRSVLCGERHAACGGVRGGSR